MKTQSFIVAFFIIFILAACLPSTIIPVPTGTIAATQTITPLYPTLTPTIWITPEVTATPLNIALSTKGEINLLIERLHPGICTGINLAIKTLTPDDMRAPSQLKFTELETLPDPKSYYVNEIANNIDNSHQAFIACSPDKFCVDKVYVKDNITGKGYEVDFGAQPNRPLQWLIWVNKDTFIVAQSSNPWYGKFVAINFVRREYEYYGMAYECLQPTSTP